MTCPVCGLELDPSDAHFVGPPVSSENFAVERVAVHPDCCQECGEKRIGSLFSGIGGLELGLERAGVGHTVWQVEKDEFCRRVLAKHWPDVKRYEDVTTVDWSSVEPVEVLCGGFPCQDISDGHTNGERLGLSGAKSGLWSEFVAAIDALRPRFVVVENVAAWRRWLPQVRADLAGLGYASVSVEVPAGSVGAPHKRPRVLVVADSHGESESLLAIDEEVAGLRPVPRGGGYWRESEPCHVRVADGVPGRMDRLRALGNAVVPQVSEVIGRHIVELAS